MLDYAATYPDAVIRYHTIEMILHGDMNSAYLVLPKACSRIASHFYLSDHPPTTNMIKPKLNGLILTICKTQKNVVTSAAEVETGGMLLNRDLMLPIRHNIIAMDHPQPENGNPIKSNRKTYVGIVRLFVNPKSSKYRDIKYHWL